MAGTKFIAPLHLLEQSGSVLKADPGFIKLFSRNNWIKHMDSLNNERDIVLNRPLDNLVPTNAVPLNTSIDIIEAFNRIQGTFNYIRLVGDVTGVAVYNDGYLEIETTGGGFDFNQLVDAIIQGSNMVITPDYINETITFDFNNDDNFISDISGQDLATADNSISNFITESEIHNNSKHTTNLVGEEEVIEAMTEKTSIIDDDIFVIEDSEDTYKPKKSLFSTIKSTLKTYFDTIYSTFSGSYNDLTDKPTIIDRIQDASDVDVTDIADTKMIEVEEVSAGVFVHKYVEKPTVSSNIRLSETFYAPTYISYLGFAPSGSLETEAVWTITKRVGSENGTIVSNVQTENVKWSERNLL